MNKRTAGAPAERRRGAPEGGVDAPIPDTAEGRETTL